MRVLKTTGFLILTTAALFGQQLFGQTVYQVDESFSTDMVFRSCGGGVWNFYVRDDGEIIVGGAFENIYHAWATPFAIGHELISPNGERNAADWGGAGVRGIFMTDYDDDFLLISTNSVPSLLRKDGSEVVSYFSPYQFVGNSGPFGIRFNHDCYVLEDKSVICAGSLATDSTDQSLWRHLYRFHTDGMLDTDFPAFEGEPNAPSLTRGTQIRRFSDGSWILSGSFMAVNGYHSPHLIKLTPEFEIDTTFVSPFGYYAGWAHQELHLLDSDDNLWIGGVKIEMPSGGLSPYNLFKVSSSGEIIADFTPGAIEGSPHTQGVYQTYPTPRIRNVIELNEGNRFIIAGRFDKYNGIRALGLTVVDGNGEIQDGYFQNKGAIYDYCSFNQNHLPSVPGIFAVHELEDGSLLVGGAFSEFNTFDHDNDDQVVEAHEHYGVVKLLKGTVSTADNGPIHPPSVYPNPTADRLRLDYDGQPDFVEVLGIDGRVLKSFGPGHGDMSTFDVGELAPGMYLLRIVERRRNVSETVRFVKVD